MHNSVFVFVKDALVYVPYRERTVLEAGSLDVNGSIKPLFDGCRSYVGLDMRPGPRVDVVCPIEYYRGRPVDVVVSTEMLEHCSDWRAALTSLHANLKPGGWLILTTRSKGFPLHGYPEDFWRFSVPFMEHCFATWTKPLVMDDPEQPGVFVLAQAPLTWDIPAWEPEGV